MIEHDGVPYYPDDRGYLTARGGKGYHVVLWEEANGPVPPGHLVHHVDEDPSHNELANFAVVTRSEHAKLHGQTVPPEVQAMGREAAKAWHASPAGRKWHREQALRMVAEGTNAFARQEPLVCSWCGTEYVGHRRRSRPCCGERACRAARQSEYDSRRTRKGDRHRATTP